MPPERYKHIFLPGPTHERGFTSPRKGRADPRIPLRNNRAGHSAYLKQRFEEIWQSFEERQAVVHVERHGAYIEFVSEPGFDLAVLSLEAIRSGIRLQNVRREGEGETERTFATVYVPHDKRGIFLNKVHKYATEDSRSDKPKNEKLINSISDIKNAVLESFWRTEERLLIPNDAPEGVEVWLNSDTDETVSDFENLLQSLTIESSEGSIRFPERSVKLIWANKTQLTQLIESSDSIAEFRIAKEVASFYIEMENIEQLENVQDLINRCTFNEDPNVAVCILDTGVNNGHALLGPVLNNSDLHTVLNAWGSHDHDGHGTLMAGTAAYGDILELLNSGQAVQISHCLESAKILPPPPQENPKRLWGYFTAQGISLAEIQAPERKRIICVATTTTDDLDQGRPSSWSGAVDGLASGSEDDIRRLIIISAGNVSGPEHWLNYPDDNLTSSVHDPGQAWNAVTVGAFTEKTSITTPSLSSYTAIAPSGSLSPYSSTSHDWSPRRWPIKPEVVFEGGNVAKGPNNSIFDPEDLKLLSTYYKPQTAQFAPFWATSAASAQAAWMGAQIQVLYPDIWPETIRALIIHSSDWTEMMLQDFLENESKGAYARLLRICGYGVPSIERALYCLSNSLTLISEATLQPYDKRDSRYVTRDMHLYNLPWPTDILLDRGEMEVTMRVTLSYFIEPGPGEIGWDNRYRYASHALRFDVNGPGESEDEFIRRVNSQARDDGEHPGTEGTSERWKIGEARNVGSIHSDIWEGSAADLAGSNIIAVYPAVGWWRERNHLGKWDKNARYALLVSITTPEETIDIYTPVANQVGITIPITT